MCETTWGWCPRQTPDPAPIEPTEITTGLVVGTRAREDHFDLETISVLADTGLGALRWAGVLS
jgi:hypothetical protein